MTPDAVRGVRPAPRSLSTEALERMVHAELLAAGRGNPRIGNCVDVDELVVE